jgi:hypothetical protein
MALKRQKEEEKPKVDQKEFWAFRDEIVKLAKKKFGTDDDGRGSLVEVTLVDRTRCQRLHYWPVPYRHKIKSVADEDNYCRALSVNLHLAQDDVENYFKHLQSEQVDTQTQQERIAVAAKSKLRLCWVHGCSNCGGLTYEKEAEMDRMGFIHYGQPRDEQIPKAEPKKINYHSGIYRFMLPGDYKITWCPEPIVFDKKPRLPWGIIELDKLGARTEEVSQFRYDAGKPEGERLILQHKDHIPPIVLPKLEAEISRPLIPLPKGK